MASGIDIQLAKRRDTLVQAFDATSKFMKYEKSYILEDTKLRNINVNANSRNEVEEISNSAFSKLLAVNDNIQISNLQNMCKI